MASGSGSFAAAWIQRVPRKVVLHVRPSSLCSPYASIEASGWWRVRTVHGVPAEGSPFPLPPRPLRRSPRRPPRDEPFMCTHERPISSSHSRRTRIFRRWGRNCNCNHDCNCSSAWQHLTHTHTHAHAHNTHELLHHRHDVQHPGALPMAFQHVTRVFETLVHTIACVRWTVNYENTNAAPMAQLRKLPLTRVIITLSPGPSLPSPNLSASQPCNPLPRPALFQIPVCCIRPSSRALGS